MASFTRRIQAGLDDAAFENYNSFNNNGNFVDLGGHGGIADQVGQLRWTNVTIPKDSTINAATITFTTPGFGDGNNNIFMKIRGIAEDNTANFSSDGKGRTRTSAGVDWDLNAIEANTEYTTPDISSVIQEIISRAGWVSGNALGVLIDDDGSADNDTHSFIAYEWDTTKAALLSITYTAPSGVVVQKNLVYRVKTVPSISKLCRYVVVDPETEPVPFFGIKIAKAGHNVLNTQNPNNLKFSSQFNTLKYFMNGHKALHVSQLVSTQYTQVSFVEHNLGYLPMAFVYAKDDLMPEYQPLGHWQAGSGAYRQFFYYVTTTKLYVVARGWTGTISGDTYDVDFYYKIFKNNLNL